MIARLYHSTACLTADGTIIVSGCDRCWKFNSTLPYSPSKTAKGGLIKADYRVEIFYPPYYYSLVKPVILSTPPVRILADTPPPCSIYPAPASPASLATPTQPDLALPCPAMSCLALACPTDEARMTHSALSFKPCPKAALSCL